MRREGHCQLKQGWYPPAVGGAAVRCREVLHAYRAAPSQEKGAKKVDSTDRRLNSSSQPTHRWRETDSNPRSLFMTTSLVNLHLSPEAALCR